uniref:Uncharacterized protein n=1 Tax=Anguilla anguilla TaxID=7936 RepID=A0A0E9US39_ANGAN
MVNSRWGTDVAVLAKTLLTRPGALNYKSPSLLPLSGIQLRYNHSRLYTPAGG